MDSKLCFFAIHFQGRVADSFDAGLGELQFVKEILINTKHISEISNSLPELHCVELSVTDMTFVCISIACVYYWNTDLFI